MKNNIGVWIDGTEAFIVKLNNDSVKKINSEIENKVHHHGEGDKGSFVGGGHHINNDKKFEERKHHEMHNYFKEVISEIKDADEIFVFGPSEMKFHLKTEIEKDKHLINKLSSVEPADKLSEHQIVAAVKEYFKVSKK
jgi:hypothetical protein